MKRRTKIILGIGIPVGIIMLVIKNQLNISDGDFWKQYAIMGAVVIAIAVLINCLHQVKFIRQLNNISKRMTETGDLDEFVEALEYMLDRSKSDFRKNLVCINLSYAYSKKKEYATGLAILESIDPKKVKGVNQIIYLLNIVSFHFYLKNYEEVIDITEQHLAVFAKFKNHTQIGFPVAVNNICYYIAKGEISQAKELLEEAGEKWTDKEMQEEWQFLAEVIEESEES